LLLFSARKEFVDLGKKKKEKILEEGTRMNGESRITIAFGILFMK
jgi:hypothetical protein